MENWNMTNSLTVVGVLTSNVLFQRTLIRVHALKDKDYLHRQVKNLVIFVYVNVCENYLLYMYMDTGVHVE